MVEPYDRDGGGIVGQVRGVTGEHWVGREGQWVNLLPFPALKVVGDVGTDGME